MERCVTVNINSLLDIGRRTQYSKEFGYQYFRAKSSKGAGARNIRIKIVEGAEAQFVNLFGVFVDLKSGDIALGMFPRSDEYVCVGNLFKMLARCWFGSSKFPEAIDKKYIIELLKIDPIYYEDEIIQEVSDAFELGGSVAETYKSVTLYYIKDRFKRYGGEEFEYFRRIVKENKFLEETISVIINLFITYERIARDYYGAFLAEQYDSDLEKYNNKTLEEVLSGKEPNMEALTVRYLKLGFPLVFLNALKSYGFYIKDRKQIFNKSVPKDMKRSNYSGQEIIDIGKALSSMFYSRNVIKKELLLAYNFMDLLRAVNWEQNILFSLDLMVDIKSKVVWESLLKRFHIYEILSEQNLSEKEFVMAIDTYRKSILTQIDCGLCYKRFASENQYRMLSFSPTQLDNAGRIFEMTFTMLNKSLNI